mmetsp:Transcript_69567/g.151382  ORF Transcript_69567/g.151382 Transcript_69567/m.151382 type:complete len:311 (+) Transcript_69567:918-1850(+)
MLSLRSLIWQVSQVAAQDAQEGLSRRQQALRSSSTCGVESSDCRCRCSQSCCLCFYWGQAALEVPSLCLVPGHSSLRLLCHLLIDPLAQGREDPMRHLDALEGVVREGEKLCHWEHESSNISQQGCVVLHVAWTNHHLSGGDALIDEPTMLHRDEGIQLTVNYQGWAADLGRETLIGESVVNHLRQKAHLTPEQRPDAQEGAHQDNSSYLILHSERHSGSSAKGPTKEFDTIKGPAYCLCGKPQCAHCIRHNPRLISPARTYSVARILHSEHVDLKEVAKGGGERVAQTEVLCVGMEVDYEESGMLEGQE